MPSAAFARSTAATTAAIRVFSRSETSASCAEVETKALDTASVERTSRRCVCATSACTSRTAACVAPSVRWTSVSARRASPTAARPLRRLACTSPRSVRADATRSMARSSASRVLLRVARTRSSAARPAWATRCAIFSATVETNVALTCVWSVVAPTPVIFGAIGFAFSLT